jgi:nitroreductase
MEFSEVINHRRSIRKYSEKNVPDNVIRTALKDALLAPNSSNLQHWEFYWVREKSKKKTLVEACLMQTAAKTAPELIVVVSRIDTWRRNSKLILDQLKKSDLNASKYYTRLIPFIYTIDPFNILGFLKTILTCIISIFRPIPSAGTSRSGLFEIATKSTALACENFMLSIVNQGYSCCPMEGFDERRVKKLLSLPHFTSHIVMVISVGESAPDNPIRPRLRLPDQLFIFEI